jgi:hypothetical protein
MKIVSFFLFLSFSLPLSPVSLLTLPELERKLKSPFTPPSKRAEFLEEWIIMKQNEFPEISRITFLREYFHMCSNE